MDPVIARIRNELDSIADPALQENSKRFFKEEIRCYGTKTAAVITLAKKYWKEVRDRPKPEVFALCEELYRSGYMEESFIVSEWAHSLSGKYERDDLNVFRHWIDTYITNRGIRNLCSKLIETNPCIQQPAAKIEMMK